MLLCNLKTIDTILQEAKFGELVYDGCPIDKETDAILFKGYYNENDPENSNKTDFVQYKTIIEFRGKFLATMKSTNEDQKKYKFLEKTEVNGMVIKATKLNNKQKIVEKIEIIRDLSFMYLFFSTIRKNETFIKSLECLPKKTDLKNTIEGFLGIRR